MTDTLAAAGAHANGHVPQDAEAVAPPASGAMADGRVRLRRLELHGFKTFAARTSLELAPGITAVVGPNGSGKSNVADAVRWVLGEQSVRLLRGRKSEDVIFSGGAGRAPLGMAEVHLTLENAPVAGPVQFAEVEVGRRAFRSGESEYYLNRGRVRLRDVVDVLSRAGIGQHGHTVIGQGMVDLALALRPEERRALFEDAGGQRRFHAKRDEAESKLAEVRANATRVADIIAELEPRLAALQRQARRAQDESRVRAQLREATVTHLAHQRWELEQGLADWQRRASVLQDSLTSASAALAAQEPETEALRRDLATARAALAAATTAHALARERVDQAQRALAVAGERRRAAQQTAAERAAAVERLERRASEAASALPDAETLLEQAGHATAQARERATAAQAALHAHPTSGPGHNAALREAQDAQADATRTLTQVTTRLREAERQLDTVRRQAAEAADGRQRAIDAAASVTRRLAALEAQRAERQALMEQASTARTAAAAERAHVERDLLDVRERRQTAERELSTLGARAAVLRDVSGASAPRQRAPDGARSPRAAAPEDQPDQRVAELLDVPAELESAVAAAAGPALDWIVVPSAEDVARRAHERAEGNGERATFIAHQAPGGGNGHEEARPALPDHEGGIGFLPDVLPGHANGSGALYQQLLAGTYVMKDLAGALALAAGLNGGPRPRIVTLSGETVHAHGAVTAGAPPDEAATLRRQRELRDAESQLAALRAALPPLTERLRDLDAAHTAAVAAERAADARLRELAQQESREDGERRAIAQQEGRLSRDATWWDDYAARSTAQIESIEGQLQQLASERMAAQAAHQRAATALQGAQAAASAAQAEIASLRDAAASATTAAAVAEQRLAQAEQRLANERRTRATLDEELRLARTRAADARDALAGVERDVQAATGAVEAQHGALQEATQQVSELQRAVADADEAQEAHRERIERARAGQAAAQRDLAMLEAERATLAERLRALQELAQRELGDLPPAACAADEPDVLARRVASLEQRLRSLGPVNQVAMQEHAEASEHLTFLNGQLDDLRRTAAQLEVARADLEAGLAADFGRTFEAVATHFRTYFRRLFNGGDAALTLTDPKNLADTGIEISAQLPGKRRQELALLSGGERALVAAALLFALLKARPSPFCVMDEVDAALDEANVGRFCDVLEELSHQTQFVVITHNRATMERADTLYGVTLGDDGVSRIVSLNVRDAMAAVGGGKALT